MKLMIGMGVTESKAYCFADVMTALKTTTIPKDFDSKGLQFIFNSLDSGFYQLYADVLYKLHMPFMQLDIAPVEDTMQNKVNVRNALLAAAKQTGCDALLMLDADIALLPHTIEAMWMCAKQTEADVVTVPYAVTNGDKVCRDIFLLSSGGLHIIESDTGLPNYLKVDACGMGCVLLRNKALDVPFRLTDKPEDLQWCDDYDGDIICLGQEEVKHKVEVKNE